MWWKLLITLIVIAASCNFAFAGCPSADLNDNCFVNFVDFALMANQWPNVYDNNDVRTLASQWLTTDPCMAYIPGGEFDMGDHFAEGIDDYDSLPVHAVFLDSFFMSKFEITNQQYCKYLNSAEGSGEIKVVDGVVYASSDSSNSYPYCNTHGYYYSYYYRSQIDYNNVSGTFSVRTKRDPPLDDMSNDPMVEVSWYGSAAYCNWRSDQEGYEACYNLSTWDCNFANNGYRLPTEAEWEYAARGGLSGKRFPWADPNITHSQANYYSSGYPSYDVSPTRGYHPDYNDMTWPITAPVGSFSANGYGLYDMVGNVMEWCNDWWNSTYYSTSPYNNPQGPVSGNRRVLRGGCWFAYANFCRVANRPDTYWEPNGRYYDVGFRVVMNLE